MNGDEPGLVCVDHYPPLQIVNKDGSVEGFNIQVLKAVAKRANISLSFKTNIPFSRCLHCMKQGQCDLMIGLLDVDERRSYMNLFQYSGQSDKVFYVKSDSPIAVNRFEDLKGLTVCVNHGYRYFEKFDQEKELFEKVFVSDRKQLFRMLLTDRVDAIICNFEICESYIQQNSSWENKFRRLQLSYVGENPSYIGLSKKSHLIKYKTELEAVVSDMFLSGEVENIVDRYSRERPESN